jgi:hypothetical protein
MIKFVIWKQIKNQNKMKMMKKPILSFFVLSAAVLALMAFTFSTGRSFFNPFDPPQEKVAPDFPDSVQKVFESSCFDCHSDKSSNDKALSKMNLSEWGQLSVAKKVGKMQDIIDMINKGDMPPAKWVSKYPDRAPGKEQKDVLIKWATEESNKLMNK